MPVFAKCERPLIIVLEFQRSQRGYRTSRQTRNRDVFLENVLTEDIIPDEAGFRHLVVLFASLTAR